MGMISFRKQIVKHLLTILPVILLATPHLGWSAVESESKKIKDFRDAFYNEEVISLGKSKESLINVTKGDYLKNLIRICVQAEDAEEFERDFEDVKNNKHLNLKELDPNLLEAYKNKLLKLVPSYKDQLANSHDESKDDVLFPSSSHEKNRLPLKDFFSGQDSKKSPTKNKNKKPSAANKKSTRPQKRLSVDDRFEKELETFSKRFPSVKDFSKSASDTPAQDPRSQKDHLKLEQIKNLISNFETELKEDGTLRFYGMIYEKCVSHFKISHYNSTEVESFGGENCPKLTEGVTVSDSNGKGRKCIEQINQTMGFSKVTCGESEKSTNHCVPLSRKFSELKVKNPFIEEIKLLVNDPGKDRASIACHSFEPPLHTKLKKENDKKAENERKQRADAARKLLQVQKCRASLNQLTVAEQALANLEKIDPAFSGLNGDQYLNLRNELATRRAQLQKEKDEADRIAQEKKEAEEKKQAEIAAKKAEEDEKVREIEEKKEEEKAKKRRDADFKALLKGPQTVHMDELEDLKDKLVAWAHDNPQDRSKIVQALYRIMVRYSRDMPKKGKDEEDLSPEEQIDIKLDHIEKAEAVLEAARGIAEGMKEEDDRKTQREGRKYLSDFKNTERSLSTLRIQTLARRGSNDSEFRSEYRKLFQSAIRTQMSACSMITSIEAYERCTNAQQRMMDLNQIPRIAQQTDMAMYANRYQSQMMMRQGGFGGGFGGYGGYGGIGGGYPGFGFGGNPMMNPGMGRGGYFGGSYPGFGGGWGSMW